MFFSAQNICKLVILYLCIDLCHTDCQHACNEKCKCIPGHLYISEEQDIYRVTGDVILLCPYPVSVQGGYQILETLRKYITYETWKQVMVGTHTNGNENFNYMVFSCKYL